MVASLPQRSGTRRRGRRLALRLDLETLETRSLPTVTTWAGLLNPAAETEPNDTLDQAQNLGDLSTTPRAEVIGTITNASLGGSVDWYCFQLDRAANVKIGTPNAQPSSSPVTTLSLYTSDPGDANDPYDPLGYRLLEQADSAAQGGAASIERRLAPGTYYVAVSGSGNHYFNPFLAGSGYAGATGDYGLLITATELDLGSSDGPAVLAADPQPGANVDRSPFLIRVDVSEPLDLGTVSAGGTVGLLSNQNGTFGDGNDQPVTLASASLNTPANELLIAPAAPLAPGYYKVVLAGDSSANAQVLADPEGIPLGASSSQPSGADFTYTFQISGNEGSTTDGGTADDTPATSHELGDVTQAGLVQVEGAIGDDSTDPIPFDGSDVDLYHFRLSGSGRYAFTAELFAGRIGSPLFPGVSLFQVDATTGQLSLLGSNAGTFNPALATNGTTPLFSDPVLYAGLQAGDYYVAVSNNFNVPDPVNSPPGTNGVFDPNVSQSGQNGGSTGNYVLNLLVQPTIQNPPQVLSVTPQEGATLDAPPAHLTVQFSEPVNLPQLVLQTFLDNTSCTLAAVYVERSDGTKYYPRFDSYDPNTNQATFLMLDSLSNDSYQLHLSGPVGLADLAGNALVGNDPSGDYVVHFTVNAPTRGTGNNPLLRLDQEPNNNFGHSQDLGTLFRHDLETGVALQRDFTQNPENAPADTADYYQFQVLEAGGYYFNFSSSSLPSGATATLLDSSGKSVGLSRQPNHLGFLAVLQPGTYVLHVGDWKPNQAAGVKYTVVITLGSTIDNPVPLTVGPAPAISIRPVTDAPPSPPPAPLVVSPPLTRSTPAPQSNPPFSGGPPTTELPVASTATSLLPPAVVANPPAPATAPSPPATTAEQPAEALATATAPASPAPAPASVVLLVSLVAPSGVYNPGIAPAGLHGTSDRPAQSVSLPSAVLLALGAAPVGGIRESTVIDTPGPVDRVLVRLPDLSASKQPQAGMAAIARIESGRGTIDPRPGSPLSSVETACASARFFQSIQEASASSVDLRLGKLTTLLSQALRQLVNTCYGGAVDAFFSMARWMEEAPLRSPKSGSSPEDFSAEEETAAYEGQGTTLPPGTAQVPNAANQVLFIGLSALAAVAVATEKKQGSEVTDQKSEIRDERSDTRVSLARF